MQNAIEQAKQSVQRGEVSQRAANIINALLKIIEEQRIELDKENKGMAEK